MFMDSGVLPKWLVWLTGILGLAGALLLLVVRFYQIQGARAAADQALNSSPEEDENQRGRGWNHAGKPGFLGHGKFPRRDGRNPSSNQPENKTAEPIVLFDGQTLSGWTSRSGNPASSWIVRDGAITNTSVREGLFTIREFENFKLELDYLLPNNCDSGIFLRGRYEVPLLDERKFPKRPPVRNVSHTSGPSSSPAKNANRGIDTWHRMEITLVGDDLTVVLNGDKILETKVDEPNQGALFPAKGGTGPIMLQSATRNGPKFRNLKVIPLEKPFSKPR